MFAGCLEPIQVDRGEFVTGRNALHAALYPSQDKGNPVARTVWRWLETLEAMECVKLRTVSNRCTVVSVCKYKDYQDANQDNVQPVSNPCPADVPPVSTDKERNNNTSLSRAEDFAFLAGCNEASLKIENDDGSMLDYRADPLVWQWLFIRRWNGLPNVANHRENRLSEYCERELVKRFEERNWDWRSAMAAFPINYERMSLVKFVEFGTVQKINAGDWRIPDFVKTKGKKHDRQVSNPGQVYNEAVGQPAPPPGRRW